MHRFNYQIVLTGVIVGLAVAEVLRCVANLVTSRQRTKAYWVHVVWLAMVFMMCVQYWFAAYYWRKPDSESHSFVEFLAGLSVPVMLYLAAMVITPREDQGEGLTDFRAYYYANHRGIFAVFALTVLVYAVQRTVLGGGAWLRSSNLVRFLGVAMLVSLMVWRHPRFHEVMVVALLLVFAVFVALF